MIRRLMAVVLCVSMLLGVTACNSSKKAEEEKEKAKQEEIKRENEAKANAFISAVEALPELKKMKLKDEPAVAGARALYDELTDEQKELVPAETLETLEAAEERMEQRKQLRAKRKKERKENKEAASKAIDAINAIPSTVTLDAENTVYAARNAYSQLTEAQKEFVSDDVLSKLTSAEATIQKLKEEKAKKEEEARKAAEKKKQEKASKNKKKEEKKSSKKETKKEEKKEDKYSIAKKYIGKKASALVAAIGSPKRKKKNPNCATDGEEYIYYYDGFYVGVLSQTMDSPLIVQTVQK